MSKIFDSVIIYGSGTTNSSTLETLNGNKINTFTIKDNGNVGIGTSTPTEKLEVSGKTKSTLLQMTSGATEGYLLTALDNQGNIAWKPFNNEDITELAPVISIQSTPPISNIDGDRYLISGGTGVWSGKTNLISEWLNPNWLYTTGVTDNTVFVTDTLTTVRYNGSNWTPYRGTAILQNGNKLNTSVNIGSNDNNDVNFRSSGTTRMTIKNNGNVGIGTATPSAKLHVVGNASTGDTVNPLIVKGIYDNTFLISNQNAYANPNRMGVYSTIYDNRFNIDLAGSAGQFRLNYGNSKFWMNPYPMAFGTTFLFASNPSGGSGESGIEHTVNCLGSYNIGEILNIGCDGSSTGVTYFGKYIRKSNFNNPNATFYPLIALDGNVGLGTSTPTASLHLINTTTGHTFIAQDSNPDSTPFVIDNNGNVGIGTSTPDSKLVIKGSDSSSSNYGLKVQNSGGTDNFVVRNDGLITVNDVTNGSDSSNSVRFYQTIPATGTYNYGFLSVGAPTYANYAAVGNTSRTHFYSSESPKTAYEADMAATVSSPYRAGFGASVIGINTGGTNVALYSDVRNGVSNYTIYSVNGDSFFNKTSMTLNGKTNGSDSVFSVNNSGGTNNFVVRNDGNVGIGTSTPDNSAILQVDSTTKGFLPPRMTASQAEAISNPSEGLMVYITGGTGSVITSKGWWGTTGTTSADWVKIGP